MKTHELRLQYAFLTASFQRVADVWLSTIFRTIKFACAQSGCTFRWIDPATHTKHIKAEHKDFGTRQRKHRSPSVRLSREEADGDKLEETWIDIDRLIGAREISLSWPEPIRSLPGVPSSPQSSQCSPLLYGGEPAFSSGHSSDLYYENFITSGLHEPQYCPVVEHTDLWPPTSDLLDLFGGPVLYTAEQLYTGPESQTHLERCGCESHQDLAYGLWQRDGRF